MDPAHLGKCSWLFLHIQKGNMRESGFSGPRMPRGSRGRRQSGSQKRLCGKRRNTYVDLKTFASECLNLLGDSSQVLYWLRVCLLLPKDAMWTKKSKHLSAELLGQAGHDHNFLASRFTLSQVRLQESLFSAGGSNKWSGCLAN